MNYSPPTTQTVSLLDVVAKYSAAFTLRLIVFRSLSSELQRRKRQQPAPQAEKHF